MSSRFGTKLGQTSVGKRVAVIVAIPAVYLTLSAGAALANGGLAYQRR